MAIKLAYKNPARYLGTQGLESFVEPDVYNWTDVRTGVDRVHGKRIIATANGGFTDTPVAGGATLVSIRDGTSDHVQLNYAKAHSAITIGIIINRTLNSGSIPYARVFDKGGLDFLYYNTDVLNMTWYRDYTSVGGIWSWALTPLNTPVFMTASQGVGFGTTPIVYYNGVFQTVTTDSTPSGSFNVNDTDSYVLGNRISDFSRNWFGYLSDMIIIPRVLSPDEHVAWSADFWYFMRKNRQLHYMDIGAVSPPTYSRNQSFWHAFI